MEVLKYLLVLSQELTSEGLKYFIIDLTFFIATENNKI